MGHVFYATKVSVKKLPHEETEQIEVLWLTFNEINDIIKKGEHLVSEFLASWSLYLASAPHG